MALFLLIREKIYLSTLSVKPLSTLNLPIGKFSLLTISDEETIIQKRKINGSPRIIRNITVISFEMKSPKNHLLRYNVIMPKCAIGII